MLPVRSLGAGPPCLLLHGFTGSGAAWPQACVDGVGRHGRLLVPDLPGHGAAHRSNTVESYRLPSVLDALVGALDRAGVDRAVWMGYSMGGRLALAAAVLRPERVAGLVLESASPGLATEGERAARRDRDHRLAKRILEDGTAAFVDAWMSQPLFAIELGNLQPLRPLDLRLIKQQIALVLRIGRLVVRHWLVWSVAEGCAVRRKLRTAWRAGY